MKRNGNWFAAAGLLWGVIVILSTHSTARADPFDEIVRAEMTRANLPGVAIAVTRGTNVIKTQGYGEANLEWKTPADENTVFQLASLTKQFTAVAIEILIQEKKLGQEDRAAQYLDYLPASWSKITIRQLLNHTSGIKNYTALTNFMKLTTLPVQPRDLVNTVRDFPLDFPPGDRYSYSNTGYYLLGCIIETVTRQPYAEFLAQRIFKPLGMNATRVNSNSEIIPRRAGGYRLKNGVLENAEYIDYTWPFAAGAIVSTARDMAQWHIALLRGRVLTRDVLEEMWSPAKLNDGGESSYGMGWTVKKQKGHRLVNHAGGIAGFGTFAEFDPDLKLSVTVLINSENGSPERLADRLLAAADSTFKIQTIPEEYPEYTERTREIFRGLAAGDLSKAPLSAAMRQSLEKGLDEKAQFVSALGTMQKVEVLEQQVSGESAEFRYRLVFEKGALDTRLLFNSGKNATRIEIHRE